MECGSIRNGTAETRGQRTEGGNAETHQTAEEDYALRVRGPAQVVFPGFGGSGWSLMMPFSASATPTVLRSAGEQGFGQPAAREHAACGSNRVFGRCVGRPGSPPALDLLPDCLKLLRRQRSDLIQYSLGLRAHDFNLTCSA